tara:strand:- start:595 stop:846 length:252 start_codon:yes stop_codon:yes gene_type:complete
MKSFNITLSIRGQYEEGDYLDLDSFKFIDPISLDDLVEDISFYLLCFEKSNAEISVVHLDNSEEEEYDKTLKDDYDEHPLGTT